MPHLWGAEGEKAEHRGKVSGSVRLVLDVPDKYIHLTEYAVWADFLYAFKFTKPGNYKSLRPDCEELTVRRYNEILADLQEQRKPSQYECPQVVLEDRPRLAEKLPHRGQGRGLFAQAVWKITAWNREERAAL